MSSIRAKVLAEVYRLHHVPLPPITLQALLQRGPRASPAIIEKLQQNPSELTKWKEMNAPQIVTSAQLLHREVPIRLARRIVDLENLPDTLPDAPSIVALREVLLESFEQLIMHPLPRNLETEQEFTNLHRQLRSKHATMHNNISDAIKELDYTPDGLDESLDAFYNSRIGIRMLVDQHIAAQIPTPGFTGIVADACSPVKIAKELVETIKPMLQASLNGEQLPEINVEGDINATYRYIPQHVELILSEVLKNAVLNSLSAKDSASSYTPPPVSILIAGGSHGMCIKVADVGGGMTRQQANALLAYHQAAALKGSYDPVAAVLERRASAMNFSDSFGLRIASLYAQYFGGALSLMPMEGHGVDAYIYMNCLTGASEVNVEASSSRNICEQRNLHDQVGYPGAAITSETESWVSAKNCTFPQELGVQILASNLYQVRTLRLTSCRDKAPAKIDILWAPRQSNTDQSQDQMQDPISQYLSAEFVPCCDPIRWQASTSTTPIVRHKAMHLDVGPCAFLKLIVYGPHPHSSNPFHQVALTDIELLGTIDSIQQTAAPFLEKKHFSAIYMSAPENFKTVDTEQDDLKSVLLDAGVSLDIVARVLELDDEGALQLPSFATDDLVVTDPPNNQTVTEAIPTNSTLDQITLQALTTSVKTDSPLNSPFDSALKRYLTQKCQEDLVYHEIMSNELSCVHRDGTSLRMSSMDYLAPAIDLGQSVPHQYDTLMKIVRYTFGEFFARCFLNGNAEIQSICLHIVEQFAVLLQETMGDIVLFEGSMALLLQSLYSQQPQIFRSSLHFAQTIFQKEQTVETPSESEMNSSPSLTRKTLGIIDRLPKTIWEYGLRQVVEAVLRNDCCWSISANTKINSTSSIALTAKGSITIDRDFLRFVRMMVTQEQTRGSFYGAIFPDAEELDSQQHQQLGKNCTRQEEDNDTQVAHRFRLFRLLLQLEYRQYMPLNAKKKVEEICKNTLKNPNLSQSSHKLSSNSLSQCHRRNDLHRLAKDCLECLLSDKRARMSDPSAIYRQLGTQPQSVLEAHIPLFQRFPLTTLEKQSITEQMQRYFTNHPRPPGLYRHSFTTKELTYEHPTILQKGNINFRGHIEERVLPSMVTHKPIEQQTQSFRFDLNEKTPNPSSTRQQEISSAFARFKGTIEVRKALNRVAPEPKVVISQPMPTISTEQLPRPVLPSHMQATLDPISNRTVPVSPRQQQETVVPNVATGLSSLSVAPPLSLNESRLNSHSHKLVTAPPLVNEENRSSASIIPQEQVMPQIPPQTTQVMNQKHASPTKEGDGSNGCSIQ